VDWIGAGLIRAVAGQDGDGARTLPSTPSGPSACSSGFWPIDRVSPRLAPAMSRLPLPEWVCFPQRYDFIQQRIARHVDAQTLVMACYTPLRETVQNLGDRPEPGDEQQVAAASPLAAVATASIPCAEPNASSVLAHLQVLDGLLYGQITHYELLRSAAGLSPPMSSG
jgi:hypothetical protein